ncbi:hypothetical protein CWC46_19855 [Prodigiosinella confusarubida]|uniref:Uncharacterized protein n=1 Tax=Serratia sp. (strain ATCC 39006) TaxID=104623 RepID=A0A2I5TNN9_SERS3|nr:hypothetical protein CWC46_19855 [Serratia sp. ATCC 39006]AUH06179.1 hypothetical protein Ser39006_019855 [Serratia sp. ATCC 39006]
MLGVERVFWRYIYEGDVNMPDYSGLTTRIFSAIALDADWREHQFSITDSFIYHVDVDEGSFKRNVIGSRGLSSDEFMCNKFMCNKFMCISVITKGY